MPTYALPVFDESGVKVLVPLVDGSLGYPHVVVLDESGASVEIPNNPPEAPPVGMFPVFDELGVVHRIAFEVVSATGDGASVRIRAYVGRRVTERWRTMQIGDHTKIEFDLFDAAGPLDLTGTALLEVELRRADGTKITRAAVAVTPTGSTVPSRLECQLQAGDVQSIGDWLAQAHVVWSGGREFRSEVWRLQVAANV